MQDLLFTEGLFLNKKDGKVLIPVASNHETKTIYFAVGQWECFRVSKKKKIKWWKAPDRRAPVWKLVSFKLNEGNYLESVFNSSLDIEEELRSVIELIELFFFCPQGVFSKRTIKAGLQRIAARRLAQKYSDRCYSPLPYKKADRYTWGEGYSYLR